jgi:hypothetical protein
MEEAIEASHLIIAIPIAVFSVLPSSSGFSRSVLLGFREKLF